MVPVGAQLLGFGEAGVVEVWVVHIDQTTKELDTDRGEDVVDQEEQKASGSDSFSGAVLSGFIV